MNTIKIKDEHLLTDKISKITLSHLNLSTYEVKIYDTSRFKYSMFTGTRNACMQYIETLKTSLSLTTLPEITLEILDIIPNDITLEVGKVYETEVTFNNQDIESSLPTYTQADMQTAEYIHGTVVGIKEGTTTISASHNSKTAHANVTIVPSKDNIMFRSLGNSVQVGGGYLVPLTENNQMIPSNEITFFSSDNTIATIGSQGQIDALKVGTVMITALYKGKKYGHVCEVRSDTP